MLPITKGCGLCIHKECAWQVTYRTRPTYPRSHTEAFDPSDDKSNREAMIACFKWVWGVHCEVNPDEQCPFDFALPL